MANVKRNIPNSIIGYQTCQINDIILYDYGEWGRKVILRAQNPQLAINRKEKIILLSYKQWLIKTETYHKVM